MNHDETHHEMIDNLIKRSIYQSDEWINDMNYDEKSQETSIEKDIIQKNFLWNFLVRVNFS